MAKMFVQWNLTPQGRRYRSADVIILSVGKSGRTWLRVLLNKYLALHTGREFSLADLDDYDGSLPKILFDHEAWSHFCDNPWYKRLAGRNVIPDTLLRRKKIVLLYRDPRDVVVSLYFQKTRRSRQRVEMPLSAFIHDPHFGIDNIVWVMNLWRDRLRDHPACHWISYEAMQMDTEAELAGLLAFVGVESILPERVREAVVFAGFPNMKKMEAEDRFGHPMLRARDPGDPDSFKVREGRVGGYLAHLGGDDLIFVNQAVRRLDPLFGYGHEEVAANV